MPGLEGMWFHDLRKTALTAFAAAGATNGEVMHIAGHTSLDVASIYQQSLDSHLDDVYRRLESGARRSRPPMGVMRRPRPRWRRCPSRRAWRR